MTQSISFIIQSLGVFFDPSAVNLHALEQPISDLPSVIHSHIDDPPPDARDTNGQTKPSMVFIHPEELVEKTFFVPQEDGAIYHAHIIETIADIEKFKEDTETSSVYLKFKCLSPFGL